MRHHATLPTPYEALCSALGAYGSQQAMAEANGVTQPTVWRWLHHARQLPAEHVLRVEADTGVSRHWLRPDIYPFGLTAGERFTGADLRAQRRFA